MPGRYAKNEISGGYVGSIDTYAYRMPVAPPIGVEVEGETDMPEDERSADAVEAAAQVVDGAE
jgi:hypothetical protein